MILYKISKICDLPDEIDPEAMDILVETAENMLSIGVHLTASEYFQLDKNELVAFKVAAENVKAKEIALIGLACQNHDFIIELMSNLRGGESKEEMMLDKFVKKAANRFKNVKFEEKKD